MKHLLLIAFSSLLSLQASTISFHSDLINEGNNRDAANEFINVHPAWQPNLADAKWISYRPDSGYPGGFVEPNQNDINGAPSVVFFEDFTVAGAGSGFVTVWADDTARVKLNGTTLFEANPVQDGACAAGTIACAPGEGQLINFSFDGPGTYQLTFEVYQRGSGPMGALYTGSATFRETGIEETPEPSTYALMGAGLLGLGLYRRRRA